MKGLILLVAFAALATYNACAQKVYIGCPEKVNATPNAGFLAPTLVRIYNPAPQ